MMEDPLASPKYPEDDKGIDKNIHRRTKGCTITQFKHTYMPNTLGNSDYSGVAVA